MTHPAPKPDVAGARERLETDADFAGASDSTWVLKTDLRLILSAYDGERTKRANAEWLLQGRNNELEIERLEVASQREEIERLRGVVELALAVVVGDEVRATLEGVLNRARQGGPDHG